MTIVGADRGRMARATAPQHLLSAGAAEVARLAVREGSPRRRDARFLDLLTSADRRVAVSTFTLDDDAIVSRSMLARRNRSAPACRRARDAVRECSGLRRRGAVARAALRSTPLDERSRPWAAMRLGRTLADDPAFHGIVGRAGTAPAVGQRDRDATRLPVQVLRAARPRARGGARRRGGDGSAAAGAVRPRGVRGVLRRVAERGPSRDHAANPRRPRASCSPPWSIARSSGCPRPRRRSSGRACSDRRRPPVSAKRCFAWKPSGRVAVVERLLEHRLKGDVHVRDGRGSRGRSRCAARPIGSICSPTARSG